MGRNADTCIRGQVAGCASCRLEEVGKAVHVVAKPQLTVAQRLLPSTTIGVKHRQVGEADACQTGGREDSAREFGDVRIGRTSRLMMHIMKLADCGIAGFLHFHEGQGGNRLHLVRRQAVQEAVHELAPCPEAVSPGDTMLVHTGHRALECVTVQI